MYRGKDRQNKPLFSSLFPFGRSFNPENCWLKIKKLIPWKKLESRYKGSFSKLGCRALDGRLVIGVLLMKHMTGLSDENIVALVNENPYMQSFCGWLCFPGSSVF